MMIRNFIFLSLLLLLTSCFAGPKQNLQLKKYNYAALKGWNEANVRPGFAAFRKSCAVISGDKTRANKLFSANETNWKDVCRKSYQAKSGSSFFEGNFTPYLVTYNGNSRGKFTGYYKTEIAASLNKTSVYKYPIYRTPDDPKLLNLSRREIENGALNGKHLEIAYAKSAAELFFMHIQGSGILRLPDGTKEKVNFAAKNNKDYTGIGSYMLQNHMIQHGSAEEIKDWLEKHPVSARSVMNMNDRYVFFTLTKANTYGSLGVELTDQATLAVDPTYIPLGVPLWLQTSIPEQGGFNRLMNAQDTGSAIKGPIRGDVYFGEGEWAAHTASGMNNDGSYFMLLPKNINPDSYF